jgi:cell division protein FtsL
MKSFLYLHLFNTLLITVVLLVITFDLHMDHKNYSTNWCSKEIEILRDQVSDIWYQYRLDKE